MYGSTYLAPSPSRRRKSVRDVPPLCKPALCKDRSITGGDQHYPHGGEHRTHQRRDRYLWNPVVTYRDNRLTMAQTSSPRLRYHNESIGYLFVCGNALIGRGWTEGILGLKIFCTTSFPLCFILVLLTAQPATAFFRKKV